MADLPIWLARAVESELEGRARRDLAERSARITSTYRAGRGSREAVAGEADALAYAVARMPATFASASRVLAEIRDLLPEFAPRSVLDAGCGPGTAGFAALDAWGDELAVLAQEDRNAAFLAQAGRFAAAAGGAFRLRQASVELGRSAAPADTAERFDLVLLGYVLAEFDLDAAATLAERMWGRTAEALAIVEPGTPDGYRRILAARRRLLAAGAHILAPCPHAKPCPLVPPDWCHFSERLPRRRAHIAAKGATLPFEDERFAYLVALRGAPPEESRAARIVAPPAISKPAIALKLCRPDGTASVETVAKRDKTRFAVARRLDWGDRFEA
ncbi:small ribosomal subunit Rsm22 family protein [Aureimonas leprariae]|uniref:SAM-dependent methyltransferase n=1 Tax=Plantimonas leprariae TaxID=2615207 RepID=A0A7V7TVX9_9HYPH|nr:small ribosomal subunit Rsm22 family protein [Aureimonas leprariae]KAB0679294.1 SAM-dependent methyltransferase [Aureimonas leprariae]